jgi:hypothetical protein
MPARTLVLTVFISSVVSAVVAFTLGLLLAAALLQAPSVQAQAGPTPTLTAAALPPAPPLPTATPTPLPVIRAQRFELLDAGGNVRAYLGESPDGQLGLQVLDSNGELRAGAVVSRADLPSVGVRGPSGTGGGALLVGPNGAVALALRSSREGGFVGLQARPDGQARLELSAPPLSSRVDVTLDTAGTAAVTVTTPQGGQGALGAAVDGRVGLGLLDGEAYRAGVGLAPDGDPFIRLFGPEGYESAPLWEAP